MIAIKDIKMPVNCEECFARTMAWCRLDEEERMVIPALPDESLEGRPEWCPLVEVKDMNGGSCSEIPNNSDTISRQAAIDALEETDWYHQNRSGEMVHGASSEDQAWYKAEDVYGVLERMPSVQPGRKKGKWINHQNDGYVDCPFCGALTTCSDGIEDLHFCFSCGAELEGEQE